MFYLHYNYWPSYINLCQWLLFLSNWKLVHLQNTFTATIILEQPGTQFIPISMSIQLLSVNLVESIMKCSMLCTDNFLCGVYDYEVSVTKQCRLFEGNANTMGYIAPSSYIQSNVGIVQLTSDLFEEYGQSCVSSCYRSRYLRCNNNSKCDCMPHSYWNSSILMCVPQMLKRGSSCQQNMNMCREDLNYTCLQFNQCGPISILSGTTIIDNNTVINGSSTIGLNTPVGISVFSTNVDSLVIADSNNNRIIGVWDANEMGQNISVIATEWSSGHSLCNPFDVYIDNSNTYNLYVSDFCNSQVVRYTNMQTINPPPLVVAGYQQSTGTGLRYLNGPFGIAADSHNNVIVASLTDSRVLFWRPNATNGTIMVDSDTIGNSLMTNEGPCGIAFDEQNSLLYVADTFNHRIQRYSINNSWPCNGTTVAGGNGPGSGSDQLYLPNDVWVSKKTGTLYIADSVNNRIQRWEKGASEGVTIAGDPYGNGGTSSTLFDVPVSITINANETYMYVTDMYNNRIQRFELI
ncbi:unnamed protein product [Adineta ricciae]|uniref:Uncharacterized protein n=1 Tax=Adineta ricciae TaxID=249248 RepID=A0A815GTW3_ADIRI|nr:unnamed protein product [Adineta ricciae]CAF1424740.1 unnamed protein product [Adineta ricciae]